MLKVSGKRFWPGAEIVYHGCGTSCKKIHRLKKIRKKIPKKIQEDTFNGLFRLHMVKQILPSGRIVIEVLGHPENFCPRCARAKICQDDLGLQETFYRPREELYNLGIW